MNQPDDVQTDESTPQPIGRRSGTSSIARMTLSVGITLIGWVVVADWLIYRTQGFSGPAVFFLIAPILMLIGRSGAREQGDSAAKWTVSFVVIALTLLGVLRIVFVGTGSVVAGLVVLTFAFALSISGTMPWAAESLLMIVRAPVDGLIWILRHRLPTLNRSHGHDPPPGATLAWVIPLVATTVFGTIFVLANPDLMSRVWSVWRWTTDWTWRWIQHVDAWETSFCILALVFGAGLFFPKLGRSRIGGLDRPLQSTTSEPAVLYSPFRNTLLCLLVLFAVYLVFEFRTLYKRDFPDGFYYAGYAHEGAAWLTAALALATGLLSLIFRGRLLSDPRVGQLKNLAWAWSGANLLLALSVYNRLSIYVGYNGLTRMRIVGFFGTSVVLVGFLLVLIKIAKEKGFWWLIRTQTLALLVGVILLAFFPSDWIAHRYNSGRVQSGYLHPSVMIAVKEKDDSGFLAAVDLVHARDPIIRDGVRAMMAKRQQGIEDQFDAKTWHWTMYQWSTQTLYRRLSTMDQPLSSFREDAAARERAIKAFKEYAMRWY